MVTATGNSSNGFPLINSSLMGRTFMFLLKFYPIFHTVAMLLNMLLYKLGICFWIIFTTDFLTGTSLILTTIFLTASYLFRFPNWYRALILGNFSSITISLFLHLLDIDALGTTLQPIIILIGVTVALYYRLIIRR